MEHDFNSGDISNDITDDFSDDHEHEPKIKQRKSKLIHFILNGTDKVLA